MFKVWANFFLVIVVLGEHAGAQHAATSFRNEKFLHTADPLTDDQTQRISQLSNTTNLEEVLDNICVVRVVGTPGHQRVKNYIKNAMKNLGWSVETDIFNDETPIFGTLAFENIIAKLNPNARRYLALACHYDSKYTREGDFVGATDSAVPCAQMINMATVMKTQLGALKQADLSLMFVFFDGEEAFQTWGPRDSIYGARHLASKWHAVKRTYGEETDITDLDKIDILVLLDLIGAPDPTFYNYFDNTVRWYSQLSQAERQLASLQQLENYSYGQPEQVYFQPYSIHANIEDDHIPFLRKNVPILHLIPYPFPPFWHKSGDNRKAVNISTTENINKILRVFVAVYFKLDV